MARLKWCGKSAPHKWQHLWLGKPRWEQDQIEKYLINFISSFPNELLGRLQEVIGDNYPR